MNCDIQPCLGYSLDDVDCAVLEEMFFDSFRTYRAILCDVLIEHPEMTRIQIRDSIVRLLKGFLIIKKSSFDGPATYRKVKRMR
jgi:hypothetical protein